jgi:hypothetical protein
MNFVIKACIALGAIALTSFSAKASTTYSITPATLSAHAGDVGDSFDVLFTNNGPGALSVSGYAFEVSVADPDITLTGADFSTTAGPFVFAGDSFDQINSFPLNIVNVDGPSPQILDASDLTNDSSGVPVAAGASVDLGRVLFDVATPAQAGPFAVTFTGEVTNVANANNLTSADFNTINVDSFSGSTITVSVPEPSSQLLVSLGVPFMLFVGQRRVQRNV